MDEPIKLARAAVEKLLKMLSARYGSASEAARLCGKSAPYFRSCEKRGSIDLAALLSALQVLNVDPCDFFASLRFGDQGIAAEYDTVDPPTDYVEILKDGDR